MVSFMLSSGFLLLYRLLIRKIFEDLFLESSSDGKNKTLIYGSDTSAIVVANALKFETPNRFNLIGFIGRNTDVASKKILGLPIFIVKQDIDKIIKEKDIKSLIIADRKIDLKSKRELVNSFIKLGCKVYTSPVVEDCENINQISKGVKSFEILDLLERDEIVLDCEKVSNKICSKTILITGAAGSIGSELVRQIVKFLPKKLILLDQAESQLYDLTIELARCNKNVEIVNCVDDIRNFELISTIFEKYRPEIVYHVAAYKHVPLMEENPRQAVLTNVLGTKNVSDLSIKFNVKTFVMVSTDKAVNPTSVMGATKRIAEKYIQAKHFSCASNTANSKTQFITTRFGNVLGSNGSVIPLFAKQIEQGGPVTITHPDIERYFMTIPEACQLVLEASAMGKGGEIFIFDMGKPIKIIDLANKMIQLAGYTPNNDIEVKCVGLRPGEKLYEELLNDSSKCLPTYNSKIMIAVEETDDYGKIETQVLALMDSFQCLSNDQIILAMKAILPNYEYFSNV